MKKTSIALTAAAGVFATAAGADHIQSNDRANNVRDLAHFTVPCTDQNGNSDDYSLTIFPETGLQENYSGHFVAEFNFTTDQRISPYASPMAQAQDTQTNVERFIFPLISISSDEGSAHDDSRTVLINNATHTAQFYLYDQMFPKPTEPKALVSCDIPDMGF